MQLYHLLYRTSTTEGVTKQLPNFWGMPMKIPEIRIGIFGNEWKCNCWNRLLPVVAPSNTIQNWLYKLKTKACRSLTIKHKILHQDGCPILVYCKGRMIIQLTTHFKCKLACLISKSIWFEILIIWRDRHFVILEPSSLGYRSAPRSLQMSIVIHTPQISMNNLVFFDGVVMIWGKRKRLC